MEDPAVPLSWIEARAGAIKPASRGEEMMSNLKYALVEEEMVAATVDSVAREKHPKPFVVSSDRESLHGSLTDRVEAALDSDFANGSMPA